MQLNFGSDTIRNFLRILSMRCNWALDKTQFETVLEYFRWDAIEFLTKTQFGSVLEYLRWVAEDFRLSDILELYYNIFDEMQWNFDLWFFLRQIEIEEVSYKCYCSLQLFLLSGVCGHKHKLSCKKVSKAYTVVSFVYLPCHNARAKMRKFYWQGLGEQWNSTN